MTRQSVPPSAKQPPVEIIDEAALDRATGGASSTVAHEAAHVVQQGQNLRKPATKSFGGTMMEGSNI